MIGLFALTLLTFASPTADSAFLAAKRQAAKTDRNVLVYFRASWCPWCRRMERLFERPELQTFWKKNYVIVPITMRERGDLVKTENKGWAELMRRLRGRADQDVPYLAIVSSTGRTLVGSYQASATIPSNAGFPATPKELNAFIKMIRQTSKPLKSDERKIRLAVSALL